MARVRRPVVAPAPPEPAGPGGPRRGIPTRIRNLHRAAAQPEGSWPGSDAPPALRIPVDGRCIDGPCPHGIQAGLGHYLEALTDRALWLRTHPSEATRPGVLEGHLAELAHAAEWNRTHPAGAA